MYRASGRSLGDTPVIEIAAAILGIIVLLAVMSFADGQTDKDEEEREDE